MSLMFIKSIRLFCISLAFCITHFWEGIIRMYRSVCDVCVCSVCVCVWHVCDVCNNMPKACLHQEIVRALGLGLRGAKRRRCRLRIRGQIAPAVLSRHSSLKKHRLVPSPLRGRGAFGAVLRASRAILTRLCM